MAHTPTTTKQPTAAAHRKVQSAAPAFCGNQQTASTVFGHDDALGAKAGSNAHGLLGRMLGKVKAPSESARRTSQTQTTQSATARLSVENCSSRLLDVANNPHSAIPHFTNGNSDTRPAIPHFTNGNSDTRPAIPHFTNGNSDTRPAVPHFTNGNWDTRPAVPHFTNGTPSLRHPDIYLTAQERQGNAMNPSAEGRRSANRIAQGQRGTSAALGSDGGGIQPCKGGILRVLGGSIAPLQGSSRLSRVTQGCAPTSLTLGYYIAGLSALTLRLIPFPPRSGCLSLQTSKTSLTRPNSAAQIHATRPQNPHFHQ